jgi:hypothetical protein
MRLACKTPCGSNTWNFVGHFQLSLNSQHSALNLFNKRLTAEVGNTFGLISITRPLHIVV